MANSVDPDQTALIGAVCSGSKLFASILNSSVMLGNYLQQMTSRQHFQMHFLLGAVRINSLLRFWMAFLPVQLQTGPVQIGNFTLSLLLRLLSSADSLCKQFRPRSGSKLFDTLIVSLKSFFEKVKYEKSQQMTRKA